MDQNLEEARRLLEEAGFADGFSFDLYVTSTYDFLRTPAELIQANLAEIGVTANIVAEDWSIYLPTVQEHDFDATILGGSRGKATRTTFYTTCFIAGGGLGTSAEYSSP